VGEAGGRGASIEGGERSTQERCIIGGESMKNWNNTGRNKKRNSTLGNVRVFEKRTGRGGAGVREGVFDEPPQVKEEREAVRKNLKYGQIGLRRNLSGGEA